jgi:hypothetical protein
MKKQWTVLLIKLLLISLFCFMGYLFFKDIYPLVNNRFSSIVSNLQKEQKVTARSQDAIRYKSDNTNASSDSRVILDKALISLNEDLKNNNTFSVEYDNIDGFYELQSYFLEYKLYISSKVKIENILNEIPSLLKKTQGLSSSDINQYFKNNQDYLEKNFGITEAEKLNTFVDAVRNFEGVSPIKILFDGNTIYHNSRKKTIYINASIKGKENKYIMLNFILSPYKSTKSQIAPYVSVEGISGGVS